MVLHSYARYDQKQGLEGNMVSVSALVHHEHMVHHSFGEADWCLTFWLKWVLGVTYDDR